MYQLCNALIDLVKMLTLVTQVVADKEGRTVFSVKAIVCADASDDAAKTIVCHQEGKVTHYTLLFDPDA